jgi:hypothetical protein
MINVSLVISIVSLAASAYAVFRAPRHVTTTQQITTTHETTHTVALPAPAVSGNAVCSKCNRAVARFEVQADASVVCANCKR